MELQEIRDQVLLATLPQVAFEGWSEAALRAGVAASGLPQADAALAFTGGAPEMIAHWSGWSDRRMLIALQDREAPAGSMPGSTGERIAAAVRARIEVNAPWREAVRRTLSWLALPINAPLAARSTYATVDAIWYACGDTATDVSFYSKRATLAAIYGATVLYWLEDQSDGSVDTWGFLDRRLRDLTVLPRLQQRLTSWLPGFPRRGGSQASDPGHGCSSPAGGDPAAY